MHHQEQAAEWAVDNREERRGEESKGEQRKGEENRGEERRGEQRRGEQRRGEERRARMINNLNECEEVEGGANNQGE